MREKWEENIWEEGLIYRISIGQITSCHRVGRPVRANVCPLERNLLSWQWLTHRLAACKPFSEGDCVCKALCALKSGPSSDPSLLCYFI